MTEPDFSKYTQEQLRQVLSRIDAARYPERVAEIEARLAALAAAPLLVEIAPASASAPSIARVAGFWRRFGAFFIDMLILAVIGIAAGAVLSDQFAALGAWGRAVGFVITLAYFGVTESHLGGGQSIGKRASGIKVVARTGSALSVPAALIRAAVFCIAYFLNGASIELGFASEWAAWAIATLIFGLVFSVFYLLIFNRRTHQSVHDLVTGAFVVRADPGTVSVSTAPVWRGHGAIIGCTVLALSLGGFLLSKKFMSNELFTSLKATQKSISTIPGVDRVSVNLNSSTSDNKTTHALFISVVIDSSTPDPEALARRIAQAALKNDAQVNRPQTVTVTLTSGYDIGLASWWRSANYAHAAEEWLAPLSGPRM